MGWGSNQRSWLHHSGPLPPLRLEPNPFRFQPSSSPFFWKEKEKEKEERGMRKKFSSIDRWTRTIFEEEREFSGLIGVFSFFFFFRAVEIRRDNRFLFFLGLRLFSFGSREIVRVANYRSTFRTEEDKFLITNLKNSILLFFPSSSECPIKFFPSTT